MATTELGEFLRTRRAAISPEDVGLVSYGARRVPGLRREEIAQLAGVSLTYYTRLEQSANHNASDGVIEALGKALALSSDELDYLRRLAKPVRRRQRKLAAPEQPRAGTISLIVSMNNPAVVIDHCNNVLAWNAVGHKLLGSPHAFDQPADLDDRPNLAVDFFLDPHGRELYVDADQIAHDMTAFLRFSSARHPDDCRLTALIGELSQHSDEFATLWAQHLVQDCGFGVKRFRHPFVGRMDLTYEVMELAESSQRMAIYHAEPGSASADALELLAHS
ncbi:helix-turn-helix transcriptional regulator [Nakamurella lactea]|uniref:helix-turn-helix transcriptional regulator n=1 Tax=Nakamurella lactea TaxID=459515 RepID=UPI000405CEA4|nr:helix-turn-helix transcriptional regulator [Nakamurella lactea]